jgi:hypothetical protein
MHLPWRMSPRAHRSLRLLALLAIVAAQLIPRASAHVTRHGTPDGKAVMVASY